MVDERYEAQQYLEGKNISIPNLYRIFTLLAKWFNEQNLSCVEIRDHIKCWAKNNKIFTNYDLNVIITSVFGKSKNSKLRSPIIKINETDINMINSKFDNGKTKLVALAILCFAKANCNRKGEFVISTVGLSAWTGVNRSRLSSRYLKELINFKFISVVEKRVNNKDRPNGNQGIRFIMNHKLHNSGCTALEENNIEKLFSELFLAPL